MCIFGFFLNVFYVWQYFTGSKIPENAQNYPEISRQGGIFWMILENCAGWIRNFRLLVGLFRDSLESTRPWQEIPGNEPKNLKLSLDISGLRRKVPGYFLLQLSLKIPPLAGCGPETLLSWPGSQESFLQ
jgi:hypothetical protein